MLVSDNSIQYVHSWEQLQQATYSTKSQAETSQLLAALDEGWQIQETATYLAHGSNAEELGYLLTLYHPRRNRIQEMNVDHGPGIEAILAMQAVPGYQVL